MQHRNANRNKLLALALALCLPLAAAQSARQSTLVLGGDFTDLITLDPGVSYEFTGSLLAGNLYDTLVAYEGNDLSKVRPRLATSWTVTPTASGSRLTFKLRDAKFSTGRPVTAADVVYSLNRVIALKTPSSFLLTDVANLKVWFGHGPRRQNGRDGHSQDRQPQHRAGAA